VAGTDRLLTGSAALVTGGGSGIGLACAKALAADGAAVTIMGRSEETLEKALVELAAVADGTHTGYAVGDVGVEADVQAAVATASAPLGGLHLTVANAGTGGLSPIIATPLEEWERVMRTNLTGTFLTFKHAGAAIANAGGGAICAISSIAGVETHRFMGPYCTTKAAIDMLVRNTADELGVAGVRVSSVCPGLVETELASALLNDETVHADYLECMPIRRTGTVDDIASAVRFLLGPESSWITGVNLSVDGGHHLRRGPNVEHFARMVYGDAVAEGRTAGASTTDG
jgi:NAD(P)-dependent dehydrogenase (short-subunit alcohol dehydrogenase family)